MPPDLVGKSSSSGPRLRRSRRRRSRAESQPLAAAHSPDKPLHARFLLGEAADPSSVPGVFALLTEGAPPGEVAAITEEVNGALARVLPKLT